MGVIAESRGDDRAGLTFRSRIWPWRTMVAWAFALSSLAALGCGPECHATTDWGSVSVIVELSPQSQVTPPEKFVISSPVEGIGTIDQSGQTEPNGASRSSFSGSVHEDPSGARTLFVTWSFRDLNPNAPPLDQFVVTVIDADGRVTGEAAETVTYRWMAADRCEPGHWVYAGVAD